MKKERGFSLVESLMVIAIMSIVIGIFVFINNTAKSQAVLDKAQTSLVSALQEARNRSASGFCNGDDGCEYRYGVRVEDNKVILFEDGGDENLGIIPLQGVSVDPFDPIIFNRLTGATEGGVINLNGGERTITITKDGNINY
jgi:prepilin-type N-terminal cleavage/methylation domain-containing protein